MNWWQVIIACVFAWISGALFNASFRDGFFEAGSGRDDSSPFAGKRGYPQSTRPWMRSPVLLLQLALLAAFLAACVLLIVVSL
jgi:hypothetical protein